ncbi:MAG TPA: PDZ domain-containing protein [candidate division Zixibacteria bacterium]|nr:PDZ domain-containing protein [candidate division Zixibacteria bacterium]
MARNNSLSVVLVIVAAVLCLIAGSVGAQVKGMKTITISDPGQTAMIPEMAALLLVKDSILEVIKINPPDQRPEKYQDVDLQKGDQIIMANGKRIHDGVELTTLLDGLQPGEMIKLGIKRNGQMRMVSFEKGAPEDLPQQVMVMTMSTDSSGAVSQNIQVMGNSDSKAEVITELGLLLVQKDKSVKVADLMSEINGIADSLPVQEGDIIKTISGKEVSSLEIFKTEFGKIKTGEEIALDIQRGDQVIKAVIIHP